MFIYWCVGEHMYDLVFCIIVYMGFEESRIVYYAISMYMHKCVQGRHYGPLTDYFCPWFCCMWVSVVVGLLVRSWESLMQVCVSVAVILIVNEDSSVIVLESMHAAGLSENESPGSCTGIRTYAMLFVDYP